VESEVGQGSRFTVSLPWSESDDTPTPVKAAQPAIAERNASLNQEPGTQEPLILLADDNEDNIDLIVGYLEAHQYRLLVARNGQEAIDRAKEEKPDLILMDVQMPELDGLEATRRLRDDPLMTTVPIIAVTALAMPGDRERCLAAGANEYLSKPVNLRGLVRIIETHLSRYRLEKEHSA
jgi:CheY-like chemotaxis protein